MRYFLVNLGESYKTAIEYKCLWAPITNNFHHKNLLLVEKDDIIFGNYNGKIFTLCIPKGKCYEAKKPYKIERWVDDGRRIDVDFVELKNPIKTSEIGEELIQLQQDKYGAYCKKKNGRYEANLGYLYTLTKEQGELLMSFVHPSILPSSTSTRIQQEYSDKKESLQEEDDQFKKIHRGDVKPYSDEELEKKNKEHKQAVTKNSTSSRIVTDPKLKATCLLKANYLCSAQPKHLTFINSTGKHPYMECHHLIPVEAQKDYDHIHLDSMFNLYSLCPGCHAKIHYGNKEAKKEVFNLLYNQRIKEFDDNGFDKKEMQSIFDKYYL